MGCGVSKKVHEDAIGARDQKISELKSELRESQKQKKTMVPKAELEALEQQTRQEREHQQSEYEQLFLETQAKHEEAIVELNKQIQAEQQRSDELEQEILRLSHLITVASLAMQTVPSYPTNEEDFNKAIDDPPIENVEEDVHNAIVSKETILPGPLQQALEQYRQNIREVEMMKFAVKLSQDKVTDYWKKVQEHETALIEQRKILLKIENQNEQLKVKNSALKDKNYKRSQAQSMSPKRAGPAIHDTQLHQFEFVTT